MTKEERDKLEAELNAELLQEEAEIAKSKAADGGYRTVNVGGGGYQTTHKSWMDSHRSYWEEDDRDVGWTHFDSNRSLSGSLRSQMGYGYSSYTSWGSGSWAGNQHDEHSKTRARLEAALNKLSRTVNVVRNTSKDRDKSLFLKWAKKGEINSPGTDSVNISPDLLLNEAEDKDPVTLDALSGQVLLGAAMKKTCAVPSFDGYMANREKPIGQVAGPVWESLEMAMARRDVLKDWAGFSPYFQRHAEKTLAKYEDVQAWVDGSVAKPHAGVAGKILAWNLYHPSQPIKVPKEYQQAVDEATKIVRSSNPEPKDRFNMCSQVAEEILKYLPPPETDPASGQPKDKGPKVTDGDLFGEPENSGKVEEEAHSADQDVKDAGDPKTMPVIPPGCAKMKLKPMIVPCHVEDGVKYRTMVQRLQPQIKAMRAALAFRNNSNSHCNHGLQSGDLDDGSLDKLALNYDNPPVFERREVVEVKDIAVTLLVDESGSMHSGRVEPARDVTISLCEALRSIKGIHLTVLGHTANMGLYKGSKSKKAADLAEWIQSLRDAGTPTHVVEYIHKDSSYLTTKGEGELVISEYYTKEHKNPFALTKTSAMSNNLDGYAMEYAAVRIANDYPESKRIVFVVSDGQPHGHSNSGNDYGGAPAVKHMHNVCEYAEHALGVLIYGVGVCNSPDQRTGEQMYGRRRFIELSDVKSSAGVIINFLRQIANNL